MPVKDDPIFILFCHDSIQAHDFKKKYSITEEESVVVGDYMGEQERTLKIDRAKHNPDSMFLQCWPPVNDKDKRTDMYKMISQHRKAVRKKRNR